MAWQLARAQRVAGAPLDVRHARQGMSGIAIASARAGGAFLPRIRIVRIPSRAVAVSVMDSRAFVPA
jgi:hypothetical protein